MKHGTTDPKGNRFDALKNVRLFSAVKVFQAWHTKQLCESSPPCFGGIVKLNEATLILDQVMSDAWPAEEAYAGVDGGEPREKCALCKGLQGAVWS